jgi:adenylosuccinate synthase
MTVSAVVGLQWGDEGKGKIVDMIGESAGVVVRCQGGSNAGHTVVLGDQIFKLHLIPSGILRDEVVCVVGNGVVVDPVKVCQELKGLEERGIAATKKLLVSERAHLNLPYHKVIDGLREIARGKDAVGTTKQGIGPCYTDKVSRVGLRCHQMKNATTFPGVLREAVRRANELVAYLGGEKLDEEAVLAEVLPAVDTLRPCVTDTVAYLHNAYDAGKNILLEGAQGAMLDVDFGTYPYLTSSNTTTGGCATGSGLPPTAIKEVHGVLKAFTTRVGAGPFPTEETGEIANILRGTGANQWDEYGTTTGRPRRCGWLDLVVGRYAAKINGVTQLHITKMDVLSGFAELKLCAAYELNGKKINTYPASLEELAACQPVYETLPGWNCDISGCRSLAELPEKAKSYLKRISDALGAPVVSVGIGPGRAQTIRG